jgi:oxygen-independent coproporphyrinogen-3 oxidase
VGVGPGAHSHIDGERWWNVKHPAAYAGRLMAGESPRHDGETIDAATARMERIMLETRLRAGLALDSLVPEGRAAVAGVVSRGLATREGDRLVLTRSGRLLADAVVRALVE